MERHKELFESVQELRDNELRYIKNERRKAERKLDEVIHTIMSSMIVICYFASIAGLVYFY